ncbi:hypothetical protein K1719_032633 [Acacia pycnantha]|nr:hypothetical protein K1719_032633 [Acacia pycnantha]
MDDAAKSPEKSLRPIKKVTVHPLVLLSIIDHENRLPSLRRVVGVLLGSSFKGIVDISNSYAVPFKEKSDDAWFLDHDYVEEMFALFKKLSAQEHIVGWYSTHTKLQENDLDIHKLFYKYIPNPVLVLADTYVSYVRSGIPIQAYYCDVEEVKEHFVTKRSEKVFVRVPSEYAADEAEEIGVEHILRDVKETTSNTLATEVSDKFTALKCFHGRINREFHSLDFFIRGFGPTSHERLYRVQDMLNHLPNLNDPELVKALTVKTNDMMMMLFLGSLIRCVIALDNLISNKIMNKELWKAKD